jgi:hypothetical protein
VIFGRLLFQRLQNWTKHLSETLTAHPSQFGFGQNPYSGLSRFVVDEGQFSKIVPLSEIPHHCAISLLICLLSRKFSLQNNIESIPRLSLFDHRYSFLELLLLENVDKSIPK